MRELGWGVGIGDEPGYYCVFGNVEQQRIASSTVSGNAPRAITEAAVIAVTGAE